MSTARYFVVGPVAGSLHRRYAVLAPDGRTVTALQASRPDGIEVEHPGRVLRWRVEPYFAPEVKAAWFNNCPPARPSVQHIKDAAAKRARGFQAGWAKRRAKAEAE